MICNNPPHDSPPHRLPSATRLTTRLNSRMFRYLLSISWALTLLGTMPGCSRVPQVLTDEAAFGELDALYTAVTSKRRDLLQACKERITKLHDEKRFSDAGFGTVQDIIEQAEQDEWSEAAQALYDFMRGQRKQP